jgi:hypothetical protein
MMQMQAAPGGMYGKLQEPPKKNRSPVRIILLLVFLLLALAFVIAVIAIASGAIRLG